MDILYSIPRNGYSVLNIYKCIFCIQYLEMDILYSIPRNGYVKLKSGYKKERVDYK